MSRRALIVGLGCLSWLGCDGGSSLGRVPVAEAGVDAAPPEQALSCSGTAPTSARVDQIVDAPAGIRWSFDSVYSLGTGVNVRAGSAVVLGSSIYWGAADDRCGMDGASQWWGVRVARLDFDPDRGVRTSWSCLRNTYRALDVTMLRVGERIGVLYREHALQQTNGQWIETAHAVGSLTFDPIAFTNTYGLIPGTRVSALTRSDGVDLLESRPTGERYLARLDADLGQIGDSARIGAKGQARDVPFGPLPWGDGELGVWRVGEGAELVFEVEHFSLDGEVRSRWTLNDRLGVAVGKLEVTSVVAIEAGALALVRLSETGAEGTYVARLCEDGRTSLRRVADASIGGSLVRRDGHWLVSLEAYALNDDGVTLSLRAIDDAGRRLGAPVQIDQAREIEEGGVVLLPGTGDAVVLYGWRETMTQPKQLRAVRVFGRSSP